MRSNSARIAIIMMVILQPAASMLSHLVEWGGLRLIDDPTAQDQAQMLRFGTLTFVATALFCWFIAFFAALEGTRGDDDRDVREGRFAFALVLVATAGYAIALNIPRTLI